MVRLVDKISEKHQYSRHKREYGKQAQKDSLDKVDTHIGAYLELHKEKCCKTADSCQRAGEDLRYRFCKCFDNSFTDRKRFMLFLESVAENDSIVDRKCKLKNDSYRV